MVLHPTSGFANSPELLQPAQERGAEEYGGLKGMGAGQLVWTLPGRLPFQGAQSGANLAQEGWWLGVCLAHWGNGLDAGPEANLQVLTKHPQG